MKNIALFGNAYAGKSTIAKALEEQGFTRLAFARGVKDAGVEAVNAIFDYLGYDTDARITFADLEQNKAVFRPLLQFIGTDLIRDFKGDKDAWVRRLLRAAEEVNYYGGAVVVDDMRFVNEAQAVADNGWLLVSVETPREVILKRTGMSNVELDAVYAHPSELQIDLIRDQFTHHGFHNDTWNQREFIDQIELLLRKAHAEKQGAGCGIS